MDQIATIADRVYGTQAGQVQPTVAPTAAPAAASISVVNSGIHHSKPKKQWVIAVSYQNLAFPYVAAMQKAIQNRAAAIGVKLIEADAVNDTSKELANVENMLAQKPDLLLFEAASLDASGRIRSMQPKRQVSL